jgi:hypothetical protein
VETRREPLLEFVCVLRRLNARDADEIETDRVGFLFDL